METSPTEGGVPFEEGSECHSPRACVRSTSRNVSRAGHLRRRLKVDVRRWTEQLEASRLYVGNLVVDSLGGLT